MLFLTEHWFWKCHFCQSKLAFSPFVQCITCRTVKGKSCFYAKQELAILNKLILKIIFSCNIKQLRRERWYVRKQIKIELIICLRVFNDSLLCAKLTLKNNNNTERF